MYPTKTQMITSAIALVILVMLCGLFAGLFLYAVGAAVTYFVKSAQDPLHYHGASPTALLLALAVWPVEAWEEIRKLFKRS